MKFSTLCRLTEDPGTAVLVWFFSLMLFSFFRTLSFYHSTPTFTA